MNSVALHRGKTDGEKSMAQIRASYTLIVLRRDRPGKVEQEEMRIAGLDFAWDRVVGSIFEDQ